MRHNHEPGESACSRRWQPPVSVGRHNATIAVQSSILLEVKTGFQVATWFARRVLPVEPSAFPAREWFVGPGHLVEMSDRFRGEMRQPDRRFFNGRDEMEPLKEVLR